MWSYHIFTESTLATAQYVFHSHLNFALYAIRLQVKLLSSFKFVVTNIPLHDLNCPWRNEELTLSTLVPSVWATLTYASFTAGDLSLQLPAELS